MREEYLNKNIIGSDETGVGDYLSPLVCSAVFVPKENVHRLEALGIKDSKKLTDKKIQELADKVKPMVRHSIKHLTQKGYNKLNSSFNANELKMFLHMGAINSLEENIEDTDLIIIDQFSTEDSIKKYEKRLLGTSFGFKEFKAPLKLVTKGESEHVAVAAASIIARDFLIKLMDKQNKEWNTVFPLGTNPIVEDFARDFVNKHGKDKLGEVAKLSFKTTEKILK